MEDGVGALHALVQDFDRLRRGRSLQTVAYPTFSRLFTSCLGVVTGRQ
jgi:hypothetical protein